MESGKIDIKIVIENKIFIFIIEENKNKGESKMSMRIIESNETKMLNVEIQNAKDYADAKNLDWGNIVYISEEDLDEIFGDLEVDANLRKMKKSAKELNYRAEFDYNPNARWGEWKFIPIR